MKIKCQYCETMFDDTNAQCPHCGAPNEGVVRKSGDQPVTIEELKAWYQSKGLPPYETTRFFIGENYQGPRAFGIYKDETSGNFVVYKNKDSGDRAVRYEGTDEAYAVNELFQRLKQEIIQQKAARLKNGGNGGGNDTGPAPIRSSGPQKPNKKGTIIGVIAVLFIILICITLLSDSHEQGYYQYSDGSTYYYLDSDSYGGWYYYDEDYGDWYAVDDTDVPGDLTDESTAQDFYYTSTWDESTQFEDFEDTEYYAEAEAEDSWDDNNNDDDDWDWGGDDGGWDDGGTDWGDDW